LLKDDSILAFRQFVTRIEHRRCHLDGFGIFQTGARVEQNHLFVGFNPTVVGQMHGGAESRRTLRADEGALTSGKQFHGLEDFTVIRGHCYHRCGNAVKSILTGRGFDYLVTIGIATIKF
jgi:hypothetical protein